MTECAAGSKLVGESTSETDLANKLVNDAIEAAVLQVTDDTNTSSDDEYTPNSDILCGGTVSAPLIERTDNTNKTTEGGGGGADASSVDSVLDSVEASQPVESFKEEDGWLFVLGHNMLKKRVINEGDGLDSRPQRGDIVTVRSTGYLDGGYQVDQHDEQTFILGDGDVIPALDLSVALMELHEICEVYTEAKYAYGERGREPDIPGDAAITYEVELLKVIGVPNFKSMSVSETIKFSDQKRQRGNFLYSRGEHSAAIMSYTKALQIIDANEMSLNAISPEEMKQLQDIRVKCFNNLAAAQLKMEAYDVAIKSCESVLREEPQNTKALFRKGKCLAGKGNLKEAIQYLRKALKLEPESKLIHQELSHLVSELKEQEQMSRLVFQRMMGTQNTGAAKRKIQTFPHWVMMIGGATIVAVISVGLAAYHYGSEKILGN